MGVSKEEVLMIMRMRDEASKTLNNIQKELGQTGKSASKASKGFKDLKSSIGSLIQAGAALGATMFASFKSVKVFAQYQEGMLNVAKTTNMAGKEFAQFQKGFDTMSSKMPVSIDELQNIASIAGQLGVSGQDNILQFTSTVAKMVTATDLTAESAAFALARISNITGEGIGGVKKLASVIVALGNNVAATESQIVRSAMEIARSTTVFKMGSEDVAALAAAFAQIGVQAEIGGSSVGRTMNALALAAAKGGKAMAMLTTLTGLSQRQFQKLIKSDPAVAFKTFLEALGPVADKAQVTAGIFKALGLSGQEIQKTIIPLAVNVQLFGDALKIARVEAKKMVALDKEYNTFASSLNSLFTTISNNMTLLGKTIGVELAPLVSSVVGELNTLIIKARNIMESLSPTIRKVVAAVLVLIPVLLSLTAIFGVLSTVVGVFFGILLSPIVLFGVLIVAIAGAVAALIIFSDQIKLSSDGVVTLRDVFTVVMDDIMLVVGPVADWIGKTFGGVAAVVLDGWGALPTSILAILTMVVEAVKWVVNVTIGIWVGGVKAVVEAWGSLPAAFKDLGYQAISGMIAIVANGIQSIVGLINPILEYFNKPGINVKDSIMKALSPTNDYKGAAAKVGAIIGKEFSDAMATDYVGNAVTALGGAAGNLAKGFRASVRDAANTRISRQFNDPRDAALGGVPLATNTNIPTTAITDPKGMKAQIAALLAQMGGSGSGKSKDPKSKFLDKLKKEVYQMGLEAEVAKNLAATMRELGVSKELATKVAKIRAEASALGMEGAKVDELVLKYVQLAKTKDAAMLAGTDFVTQMKLGFSDLQKTVVDATSLASSTINSLSGVTTKFLGNMMDKNMSFMDALKTSVGDTFKEIGKMILDHYLKVLIFKNLLGGSAGPFGFLGSMFGSAKGNAFGAVQQFARGSAFTNAVVSTPTLFKFASGGGFKQGVMGEAGPEAVMPLTRDSKGNLGVRSTASGMTQMNFQTTVTIPGQVGSSGSKKDHERVGQALNNAIKRTTVEVVTDMMRPGGMLYSARG